MLSPSSTKRDISGWSIEDVLKWAKDELNLPVNWYFFLDLLFLMLAFLHT